jgi:hypothetical protein
MKFKNILKLILVFFAVYYVVGFVVFILIAYFTNPCKGELSIISDCISPKDAFIGNVVSFKLWIYLLYWPLILIDNSYLLF